MGGGESRETPEAKPRQSTDLEMEVSIDLGASAYQGKEVNLAWKVLPSLL